MNNKNPELTCCGKDISTKMRICPPVAVEHQQVQNRNENFVGDSKPPKMKNMRVSLKHFGGASI